MAEGRSQATGGSAADVRVTEPSSAQGPATVSRDRSAEMFASGGPDVGIAGVDIWRSTITRSEDDEDESGPQDDRDLHWHISGIPTTAENDRPLLLLVGDLACSSEGWFVGVTATCILGFRDPAPFDPDDRDQVNAATRRLAPWAATLLYDTAAARARSLVASSASCSIDIPWLTPETHVTQIAPSSDPEA